MDELRALPQYLHELHACLQARDNPRAGDAASSAAGNIAALCALADAPAALGALHCRWGLAMAPISCSCAADYCASHLFAGPTNVVAFLRDTAGNEARAAPARPR